ncbi:MAG: tRNA (N6-isopentenyl adenosine(37)-C2)-methylthiotransferase MiaB, partial [Oscillospiraceae bacterium]
MDNDYLAGLKRELGRLPRRQKLFIETYGCQQNVSDSERIAGMLAEAGYERACSEEDADLIIFNTCAVREHAENRVYGHIGNLKPLKEKNPDLTVAIGGCMVHQKTVAEEIKRSFPYVDILFSTNAIKELPDILARHLATREFIDCSGDSASGVEENIPVVRDVPYRAFVPIMYGCDNFCTYCIVPYVRGRERSRLPEDIEAEFRKAVSEGRKEIMLLGQNVNSYGKKLGCGTDFSGLLKRLDALDGDFMIRFMTSHPKDASDELFRTIAESRTISRHVHLPVQSGSTRILKAMNRSYTRDQYLAMIERARRIVPGITFSTDIIVGFPGETEEDFSETLSLVKEVGYQSLFTFIYSKRT